MIVLTIIVVIAVKKWIGVYKNEIQKETNRN